MEKIPCFLIYSFLQVYFIVFAKLPFFLLFYLIIPLIKTLESISACHGFSRFRFLIFLISPVLFFLVRLDRKKEKKFAFRRSSKRVPSCEIFLTRLPESFTRRPILQRDGFQISCQSYFP